MGHFHPTEETYDKISAMLLFTPEILLHVSRPVRWDSDHVVILNDSVQMLAQEIVWADALNKVNIGLDYFDASINRIGAYVIGSRATRKLSCRRCFLRSSNCAITSRRAASSSASHCSKSRRACRGQPCTTTSA